MQEKIKNFLILSKSYLRKLFTGRLNRKNFFLSWLIIDLLFFVPAVLLSQSQSSELLIGLVILLWFIPFEVFIFSLIVRRAHDFNAPAWNGIILIFIPFGFLYLLFKKGNVETNKYGNPPEHKFNFFKIILNK